MTDLIIPQTENTLGVKLSISYSVFEFVGDSRPENVKFFFDPILSWFDEYALLNAKTTNNNIDKVLVNYKLDYFNSSSAKYILDLIKKIEAINLISEISFIQQWFYETNDDDSKHAAEEFMNMTKIPIVLVETPELKN